MYSVDMGLSWYWMSTPKAAGKFHFSSYWSNTNNGSSYKYIVEEYKIYA